MDKPEVHGGGDANNPFCKYCTDDQGNLLPKETVRTNMIQLYKDKQSKSQEEAEKLTDQLMNSMPAWKDKETVAPGEGVTPGSTAPTSASEPSMPEPTVQTESQPEASPSLSEKTETPVPGSVPGAEPASEPTSEPSVSEQPAGTAVPAAEPAKTETEPAETTAPASEEKQQAPTE
jgi:hypothetical protein